MSGEPSQIFEELLGLRVQELLLGERLESSRFACWFHARMRTADVFDNPGPRPSQRHLERLAPARNARSLLKSHETKTAAL